MARADDRTESTLDGLPRSAWGTIIQRLTGGAFVFLLAGFGGTALVASAHLDTAAAVTLIATMALYVLLVSFSGTLGTRAVRSLAGAKALLDTDRAAALHAARRALQVGVFGDRWVAAWLLVANDAEERGDLATAEEALVRALRARYTKRAPVTAERRLAVRLRLAFVRAALGRLDEAEQEIERVTPYHLEAYAIRAEYTRAQALVMYKRGRFRDVVELAARTDALSRAEDRALVTALGRSAMLRLDAAASPMRVAGEAEEPEWIERLVPELRARQ